MEKRGDINPDYTPPERPVSDKTKQASAEQLEAHTTQRLAQAAKPCCGRGCKTQ